jgi:formate hydrogenlyase subunit 3/multisubunit Na+/H+ antiporter MnhD subunit
MTQPILFIALPLLATFFTGLTGKRYGKFQSAVMNLALAGTVLISAYYVSAFVSGTRQPYTASTAGSLPPFSIAFRMALPEALTLLLINGLGLLGLSALKTTFRQKGTLSAVTYLLYFMALNGIVLTRDLFNYFVFIEISSVALAGMVLFKESGRCLKAGFSWMMATGVISIFLILSAILIYVRTGALDIDNILLTDPLVLYSGSAGAFFLFLALIFELKPFPANGWALDVYENASPAVSAVFSGAGITAGLFALYKFLPIVGNRWLFPLIIIGLVTFLFSNILALKQHIVNRMLGYSSVGQAGLIAAVFGMGVLSKEDMFFIAASLMAVHALAKGGLFWLSHHTGYTSVYEWAGIRHKPLFIFLLGFYIFALLGFPPFPSFFAKWSLISALAAGPYGWMMAAILLGSLLEAAWMIRWFGFAVKGNEQTANEIQKTPPVYTLVPALLLLGLILLLNRSRFAFILTNAWIPLLFITGFFLLDFLPARVKNTFMIGGLGLYFYFLYPTLTEFRLIFAIIFLLGGMILLLAGYHYKGRRIGFYPSSALMYSGLVGLLTAGTTVEFFFWWELMTLGSYFLILRGKKSLPHALSYFLFSMGGAYTMLSGFGLLAAANQGSLALETLSSGGPFQAVIFILLALGFLTKTATVPLHIWLPGAHSEAESDVSPVVSAVLLKAGVFGLILLMAGMGPQSLGRVNLYTALGWLGAITALIGNLSAIFEEDAKRLLAYSSIGQLGYVLFALAMMNHLGWLTATVFALNHFLIKALLFLAIGGVVMRVKTRNMYEMGGLIKRMPLSFISVMIGIIALSGVPPLTGFAGKWLSYNATVLSGWYFQGVIINFAGLVTFLYCFRLIFTIFLGQLKDQHRQVKEAPFWMMVPQIILMGVILFISTVPNVALKPVGTFLTRYFPEHALVWDGPMARSLYGYWNGYMIMLVTGVVFAAVFFWLFFINRKAVKIKQFNIVFAGERPSRPELTHFAYNFFAPYQKALGFLVAPVSTDFWNRLSEGTHAIAGFIARLFSGNGQSYVIHQILFAVLVFFLVLGGI